MHLPRGKQIIKSYILVIISSLTLLGIVMMGTKGYLSTK